MIPGSDTAKQDLILVIAGVIALLLFFWLYSDYHPLPAADNSYGEVGADNQAIEYARKFGYDTTVDPISSFEINSVLLDTLQIQTDFKEFYSNPLNRSLNPVFFWNTKILTGRQESERSQIGFAKTTAQTVEVSLSENGNLIAFRNSQDLIPNRLFQSDVMSIALGIDQIPELAFPSDSLLLRSFRFSFTGVTDTEIDSLKISRGEPHLIGREAAERMAEYYLSLSDWPQQHFVLDSFELIPFESSQIVRATYQSERTDTGKQATVILDILPTGNLISMEYNFDLISDQEDSVQSILSGIRGVLFLIVFFWIVIMLFMRFRLRLVDLKVAILVAVLGGFMFPSLFVMRELYSQFHSFESIDFYFVMTLMISVGFIAAISSIGFFVITAISDSITRQSWPEKLRTIDVLRIGHYVNVPLGLSMIRGISWGFILSLIFTLLIIVMPESYVSLEENFTADTIYFPFIFSLLGNFLMAFLVSQVLFLIFMSKIWGSFKSAAVIVLSSAFLMVLGNPLPLNIGGLSVEILMSAVIGLALGWIYLKEDFLSILLAIFVFVSIINTANGWLISDSPDAFEFYTFSILVIAGFIYGTANITSGKSANELPAFIPDYIQELASENRIKQELQIARKVQQSFLPLHTPDVDELDIYAICKPAYETGGDYYDFIEMDNDQLAVTIGDVSGKGIQAAFYMTFTKGVLYAFCDDSASTMDILSKTNKMFRKNADKGTFISLIFGMFNSTKDEFRFSRAGHNPLLFYRNREKKLYIYQPEGIAIGMADVAIFRKHISEQKIELEQDDLLIFYTDGMVEAINKEHELFGEERLNRLIKKYHQLPARQIVQKIELYLAEFVDQTDQYDDMTLIVIKKK
ncbi:MAG: PP2C family protein-serine/threonine phosphatase [Balneolaceae bacterium]